MTRPAWDDDLSVLASDAPIMERAEIANRIERILEQAVRENERLMAIERAALALIAQWDLHGVEKLVENDNPQFTHYSPAGRMVDTSMIANLRAALHGDKP